MAVLELWAAEGPRSNTDAPAWRVKWGVRQTPVPRSGLYPLVPVRPCVAAAWRIVMRSRSVSAHSSGCWPEAKYCIGTGSWGHPTLLAAAGDALACGWEGHLSPSVCRNVDGCQSSLVSCGWDCPLLSAFWPIGTSSIDPWRAGASFATLGALPFVQMP